MKTTNARRDVRILLAIGATAMWAIFCDFAAMPRRFEETFIGRFSLIGLVGGVIALSFASHWFPRRGSQLRVGAFVLLGLHAGSVAWRSHRAWASYRDVLAEPAYYVRRFAGMAVAAPAAGWVHYGLAVTAALFFVLASADLATRPRASRRFALALLAAQTVTAACIGRLLWTRGSMVALASSAAAMFVQVAVFASFGRRRDLRPLCSLAAGVTLAWLAIGAGIRARALDCMSHWGWHPDPNTCASLMELTDFRRQLVGYALQLAIPGLVMMALALGHRDTSSEINSVAPGLRAAWAGPPLLLSLLPAVEHERRVSILAERDVSGANVIAPYEQRLPSGLELINSVGLEDAGEIVFVEPRAVRVLRPAFDAGAPPTLVVPAEVDLQRLVDVGEGRPFNLVTMRDVALVVSDPDYEHLFEVSALSIRNAPIELLTVGVVIGVATENDDQWCSNLPEGGLICGGQGHDTMELHLGAATIWTKAPTMMASTTEHRVGPLSVRAIGQADVRDLSRFVRAIRVAIPATRSANVVLATGTTSHSSALPSVPIIPRRRIVAATPSAGTEIGALEPFLNLMPALWTCAPLFEGHEEIALDVALRGERAEVDGSRETRSLQDCLMGEWGNRARPSDRAADTTMTLRISLTEMTP
jgi:hypothetical protein